MNEARCRLTKGISHPTKFVNVVIQLRELRDERAVLVLAVGDAGERCFSLDNIHESIEGHFFLHGSDEVCLQLDTISIPIRSDVDCHGRLTHLLPKIVGVLPFDQSGPIVECALDHYGLVSTDVISVEGKRRGHRDAWDRTLKVELTSLLRKALKRVVSCIRRGHRWRNDSSRFDPARFD